MWKTVWLDAVGEEAWSFWDSLEEAQDNQKWLQENYGIEATIEEANDD